jgi:hypothetical protein
MGESSGRAYLLYPARQRESQRFLIRRRGLSNPVIDPSGASTSYRYYQIFRNTNNWQVKERQINFIVGGFKGIE